MTIPLLEVLILSPFDASEARLVRQALSAVDGLQRAYFGREIEDPSQGYCALQWRSLRARDAFLRSAAYDEYTRHISVQRGPFLIALPEEELEGWTATAGAPVQKLAFLRACTPIAREKVHDILALMRSGREERAAERTTIGEMYAAVVDDPDCYVIMDGWRSVAEHQAYAARASNSAALGEIIPVLEWCSSKHATEVLED
ncbi:hypothetical protein HDZ31DRAFT_62979 [Schizophyllum fasciatum]